MLRARLIIIIAAALVLASGAGLMLLRGGEWFYVTSIPVEILQQEGVEQDASTPRILTVLEQTLRNRLQERLAAELAKLKGRKIWDIDLQALRASIARDEWIQDINIARSLPSQISVRVKPKNAILVMLSNQNEFIPVTETGEILPALAEGIVPDVPVFRGDFAKQGAERRRRELAAKFVMMLGDEGPLSRANISEIAWTPDNGYSVTLIQPQVELHLGEDRIELKAQRLSQVLNYLAANNLKGRVIDASFSKKVLVRLRKGP